MVVVNGGYVQLYSEIRSSGITVKEVTYNLAFILFYMRWDFSGGTLNPGFLPGVWVRDTGGCQ